MTVEPLSPLLIRTLSQTESFTPALSYYRSRLFIVPFGNNPLVAAASPVFSLLDRLSISSTLPPVEQLRKNIEHELRAFDSRLQNCSEQIEINRLARFMLCATIDELVGKNYLRLQKEDIHFKAFSNSNNDEKTPQDLFFELLSVIKKQPQLYLDILEFAYFCLIAGIEGPYHNKPTGRQQLDGLLEELYHTILQHRPHRPSHENTQPLITKTAKKNLFHKKNIGWAGLFLLISIAAWTHYHALDNKIKQIHLHPLTNLGLHIQ